MDKLKKTFDNEKLKDRSSYDKFNKLSRNCKEFLKFFDNFYNTGAEHALKNPLNDMINKIIEVVEDPSKVDAENDVTNENGVL